MIKGIHVFKIKDFSTYQYIETENYTYIIF